MDVFRERVATLDSSGGVVECFDRSGRKLWKYPLKVSPGFVCRWSPSGRQLAIGMLNGNVQILDGGTGSPIRSFSSFPGTVTDFAFSHDGRSLAVVGEDFKVPIYDLTGSAPPIICRGHSSAVNEGAFSSDDARLATVSDDGSLRLWDRSTGKQMLKISVADVPVTGVAFAPNGRRFFVSDYGGNIRGYDVPALSSN
jgi:WD40 repeat protein